MQVIKNGSQSPVPFRAVSTRPDLTGLINNGIAELGAGAFPPAAFRFTNEGFAISGASGDIATLDSSQTSLFPVSVPQDTINVNAAARTFTRPSGGFLSNGFLPGMRVETLGFSEPGNNTRTVIESVTEDILTVQSTQLSDELGDGDEEARVALIEEDDFVVLSGFVNSENNGVWAVSSDVMGDTGGPWSVLLGKIDPAVDPVDEAEGATVTLAVGIMVQKADGAQAVGRGVVTEIGFGNFSYTPTAGETNVDGFLLIRAQRPGMETVVAEAQVVPDAMAAPADLEGDADARSSLPKMIRAIFNKLFNASAVDTTDPDDLLVQVKDDAGVVRMTQHVTKYAGTIHKSKST